jgi:hypothetical protein
VKPSTVSLSCSSLELQFLAAALKRALVSGAGAFGSAVLTLLNDPELKAAVFAPINLPRFHLAAIDHDVVLLVGTYYYA